MPGEPFHVQSRNRDAGAAAQAVARRGSAPPGRTRGAVMRADAAPLRRAAAYFPNTIGAPCAASTAAQKAAKAG
jgi:hypothetical protein